MTTDLTCPTCGAAVAADDPETSALLAAAGASLLCTPCDQADIDQRTAAVDAADELLAVDRARRIDELLDRAGVPGRHRNAVIAVPPAQFTVEPFQRAAMGWASAWARDGGILTLAGPMGGGKSTLAARAALLVLARGGRLTWRRTSDIVSGIWANDDTLRDAAERIVNRGSGALILDDLDSVKRTDAALETLGTIIDRWYADEQPLLVTTNALTTDDLIQRYGRTGERISSRLLSGHWEVVDGPDLRARGDRT